MVVEAQKLKRRQAIAQCSFALALTFAVAARASSEAYVVEGSCRDGAPNGAYALRTTDGRVRIVGAFAKGRRTGTFLFWTSSGTRVAVIPYDDNAKVGTVALWYATKKPPDSQRKLESAYASGILHGLTRSWHPNGKPRTEYRYERGLLVDARAWNASGKTLSSAEALRLAERDRTADETLYAGLEQMIADHSPRCE